MALCLFDEPDPTEGMDEVELECVLRCPFHELNPEREESASSPLSLLLLKLTSSFVVPSRCYNALAELGLLNVQAGSSMASGEGAKRGLMEGGEKGRRREEEARNECVFPPLDPGAFRVLTKRF